ncbi:MAG: agglutinin biogenesis protein MshI, partial [Gammaproteobacteria bacterium]
CNSVLALGDYQLLLTEAPDVPPAELRAAMRWRIRELIDFHVDDAVIDVFDAPAASAGGAQRQMYVVVARAALIEAQVASLQELKLDLQAIDIPELALRNVAARLPEDESGLAMLYFGEERGVIVLTRQSDLYLARTLEVGYRQLAGAGPEEAERLTETLALEVQRSVDYYDRHFMQAPVTTLVLTPLPEPVAGLAGGLQQSLGMQVRELALDEVVELAAPVDRTLAGHCLLAVGAALREEGRAL